MRRVVSAVAALAITVAAVLALAFAFASGLGACEGDEDSPPPAATVTVTETASPTASSPSDSRGGGMTVSVYLMRGEHLGVSHRTVPSSAAVATAAMNALLAGPNARERAAGLGTAIPAGTTLNGVVVEGGTARVDLSGEFAAGGGSLSMQARVAQVVYTLTQFRTVRRVDFLIDGGRVETLGGEGIMLHAGQRRSDWNDLLPAIFVETPAVGGTVRSPLTVAGTAMVFEATFVTEVLDEEGEILAQETVTASRGAPQRGRFSVEIGFLTHGARRGALLVYEVSMADGSRLNQVRIPLRFAVGQ
ncbi:MAG TPA: GerMN domain-containing protein [Thermoleophilia bacterium]|nr:GerMN domain-containing protein [Thermoleophilia bacterium]